MTGDHQVLELLQKAGIVTHGSVGLRSGSASSVYYDVKKAFGDPHLLSALAGEMFGIIHQETTCVAGSGMGGIPLAVAMAVKRKLKLCLVRETLKGHGRHTLIDGHIPEKGDVVTIIDDVLSTGSSVLRTHATLIKTGTAIRGAAVVLRRMDTEVRGLLFPVEALYTTNDLQDPPV